MPGTPWAKIYFIYTFKSLFKDNNLNNIQIQEGFYEKAFANL